MKKDLNYKQIARYLAGECSAEEKADMEFWMNEDPKQEKFITELQKIWNAKAERPKPWDVETSRKRLSKEMGRADEIRRKKPGQPGHDLKFHWSRKRGLIRVAAVFMVIALTALYAVLYMGEYVEDEQLAVHEVTTERGQRAEIRLEDGSRVRMNADSKLSHPREFGVENRTVRLSGEAYFEVMLDERPFFVYADDVVIQILGTEFNVQAYAGEEEIQVVVTNGTVAVRYAGTPVNDSTLLRKGDLARLQRNGNGGLSVSRNVDLNRHLDWLENRLTFDDTSMEEVVRKLERWYGIEIVFSDPALADVTLSATFEDESVHEVLRVMQIALDLEYEIQDRQVTLIPRS